VSGYTLDLLDDLGPNECHCEDLRRHLMMYVYSHCHITTSVRILEMITQI
jgi:hypothetical protein